MSSLPLFIRGNFQNIGQINSIVEGNIQLYILLVINYIITMQNQWAKTFVFENLASLKSTITQLMVRIEDEEVDLTHLFERYCSLSHHHVSIYDPDSGQFEQLRRSSTQKVLVNVKYLEPRFILLKYWQKGFLLPDSQSLYRSIEESIVESEIYQQPRMRQRSIREVIELVKQWREIYQHGTVYSSRRVNLQDAAKLTGIPKKSLDDYYCQLRLAEQYGFQFQQMLNQKMRVLRNFVKASRKQKSKNNSRKHEKHPTSLKILKQYDLLSHSLKDYSEPTMREELRPQIIIQKNKEQAPQLRMINESPINTHSSGSIEAQQYGSQFGQSESLQEKDSMQNNFFRVFQLPLDAEGDPYYNADRDFRRADESYDSDSLICM